MQAGTTEDLVSYKGDDPALGGIHCHNQIFAIPKRKGGTTYHRLAPRSESFKTEPGTMRMGDENR